MAARRPKKQIPAIWKMLGERLQTAREKADLTQAEAGLAIGKSLGQIVRYESGATVVSLPVLHELSTLYDMPLTYFVAHFDAFRSDGSGTEAFRDGTAKRRGRVEVLRAALERAEGGARQGVRQGQRRGGSR